MDVKMMLANVSGQTTSSQSTGGGRTITNQFALSLASTTDRPANLMVSATPGPQAPSPQPAGHPPHDALLQRLAWHASRQDPIEHALPDGQEAASDDALTLEAILERMALIQGTPDSPAQADAPASGELRADARDADGLDPGEDPWHGMPKAEAFMTVPITPSGEAAGRETAASSGQSAGQDAPRPAPMTAWESLRSEALRSQGTPASPAGADSAPRQGFMSQLDARAELPLRGAEGVTTATPASASLAAEASRPAMGGAEAAALAASTPSGGTSAPAPSGTAQASLSTPVQSQAWPTQLGQQLVQFARQGGEQRIEMQLHPAELGPLSVTLKMTEQGAQAQFLSSHAQVRQVLEQAIPQLREALAEQGIELSDTSVGEQRQQDAQGFAERNGRCAQPAGNGDEVDDTLADADGLARQAIEPGISLDGRVNLYA